jgi:2-polyprenyl-6-methoxyphenol hydroxylase-like FAD-dependent oxidoreductase
VLRENTTVTGPVLDKAGRITGVTTKGENGAVTYSAPLVVAADGNSSRLSLAMGLEKRDDRPMAWRCAPTTAAPGTTTTGSSHGSSCGTAVTTVVSGCCPATAGSSASATAPATSGSAS